MAVRINQASFPAVALETRGATTSSHLGHSLAGVLKRLLTPRRAPGFGLPESFVLAAYSLLLAWCIPHHESWFDEAQAWLIARDSSLRDLVMHRLHYEGAPALWHILLWIEIRLHVSFLGMHYIAGGLAALGVFLWLRFSPLPRVLTLLMPFTFFFQYQYAVIARSYTLCPLFAVLLLALYQNRKSSPMAFCVVAGLFANCSLHMAAFSAAMALLYAYDRLRPGSNGKSDDIGRNTLRFQSLLAPAIVLLLFFIASVATAVPTADGSSTTANPVVKNIRKIVPHGSGASVPHGSGASMAQPPASSAALGRDRIELAPGTPIQPPAQGRIATRVWRAVNIAPGSSHRKILRSGVIKHLLILLTAITVPISTSNLLAAAFLLLLALNLGRGRLWLSLAPYALVQLCNVLVAGEAHHLGLVWIALICPLWLLSLEHLHQKHGDQTASSKEQSFSPRNGAQSSLSYEELLRPALFTVMLVVVVLQIGWSVHSIRADIRGPYSGSLATADFLRHLPGSARVAGFDDDSVTVNVYLPQSPYFNQHLDYWPFSKTADPSIFLEQTMASRPDYVILKMASPNSPVMNQWVTMAPAGTVLITPAPLQLVLKNSYHETHRFCGTRFFRNASESTDCRIVFEPSATTPAHPG